MAIQTQGFGVNVMPQYTAPNASLLAFNPQQLTQGVLSSFQIADELAKQKAFRIQQEDMAATRDARMAAELANYGLISQTAPSAAASRIAQNNSIVNLAPVQDEAALLKLGQQIQTIPGQTRQIIGEQELNDAIRFDANEAAKIAAAGAAGTAQKRVDIDVRKLNKADSDLATAETIDPIKAQVDIANAQSEFDNLTTDTNLRQRMRKAQAMKLEAEAELDAARAEALKTPKARTKDQVMKELSAAQMQIQRLEGSQVINPNSDTRGVPVPLLQYQAQTRDPSGKLLQVDAPGFFTGDQPVTLNQEAERRAGELKSLYDLRNSLSSELTGVGTQAPPAPVAPQQAPSRQQIIDAVKSGQMTPDQAKALARQLGLQ